MQRGPSWLRRAATGVVAGLAATTGISALAATAAHADSTFTFTRIGGADRYATAGLFTAGAFPSGANTIYLADGLPGHQADALAASGWGGVNNYGALLTDNTNTVPANTTSALTSNKVKNVVILGGTNAVTSAQQTALTSAGYTVTRIAGASRFDTMQALDDAIPAASVGKDSSGNPTAILASGDENHLVDALSAGGVAYGLKFPVILTESSGSTLSPQAQQVITALGIKHLVVVGGTAAVPASQYTPNPSGVTKVDVEAGADRSATSKVFSDFAISQTPPWAKNSKMLLARGDDGADALASAPYSGITDALSTCVTLTPNDPGSCPAFATEHAATLTGSSIIAGGPNAVSDAAAGSVATAGGGSFPQTTPSAVTALPQLVGAKVLGTVAPNQVSSTTPAGTTVQYQFSGKVASITAADFLIYPFNWDNSGATSSCSGSQPPPAIAGAPKLSGCAGSIESNGTNVDVLFPYVSNNTSAPANQVPGNYTLATVIKGAVTTTAGTNNPEGSASIGSGSSNTTTATSNTTAAPDLTGVTFGATSSNTTQTPTNFTFSKAAFLTTGGAPGPLGGSGVNPTASGAPVLPSGQTPGFFLVFPNNVAVQCDTQGAGSNTAGGGTVAGGNGTTTITVMCANAGGAAAGGVAATNGSADSTGNVARAFVGSNTVTTNTGTAAASCPAAPAAGGAVSTTVFCNPLEAFHFGNSTTAPDLVSVTGEPAGTNGNADTTRDAVLYTFDQNANTAVTGTAFGVFQSGGNEVASTAASAGTAVGGTVNQVLAFFPKGTLNGSAAGSTGPAVGAYANGGATGGVAYSGVGTLAPSGGTTGNQPDQMGLTPSTTSTTVTPGKVDGPQLASVALSQVTTPAQTQSFVATYTFTQAVNSAGIVPGDFWLYMKDGTSMVATSCAASSTSATNTSVTCGAYTVFSSPTGVPTGIAATSAQIGSALLGTVMQDAVTGTTTGFTAKNPEGAANTTGHT